MSKNKAFFADLANAVEPTEEPVERAPRRSAVGVLESRENNLARLAKGNVLDVQQEWVDPARCRIWEQHNRDYDALTKERCEDLIEDMIAQGRQLFAAVVRRVTDDPDHDFEVISGARRHWSVSWLRANNYPDMRYLVEPRALTDEQAFRVADAENRPRQDLSDVERARDYLKALSLYYDGSQKTMAKRMGQSEAWLSRYLDLARLDPDLLGAFHDPLELKISHGMTLKSLMKTDGARAAVLAEARRLKAARDAGEEGLPVAVPDVLRALAAAAAKKPAPKKTGLEATVVKSGSGAPLLRIDGKGRKGLNLTLFPKGGGTREDAERAIQDLLDHHWPR